MFKPKEIDWKDTNVSNIGSSLDKAARENAANEEPAWDGAGKEVGLQVWRVEKFKIKEWPKEEYNHFFDGDAYIVLNTYKKNEALKWDIHFWLGAECSQDEAGTAAYKTVELDDKLNQAPVQHREVMGYESSLFLSYFKPSINILKGGVASGFNRVQAKADYSPRLLRIVQRGKKISTFQVPMHNAALNHGDVYILDKGMTLYQWQGTGSTGMERNKAAQIARAIDDERNSGVEIVVLEGDEPNADFHAMLEGTAADVVSKEEAEAAEVESCEFEKVMFKVAVAAHLIGLGDYVTWLQVSDATGDVSFEKVPLDARSSDDAFVLDIGTDVFVWVGKDASKQEHMMGMVHAQSSAQEAKPRKSRGTNSVSSFALVGLVGLASAAVAVYRRRDAILDRLGLFPGRAKGSGKSGGASINKAGAVKASKSGATPSSSVKSKSGGVQSMDSSSLPRNKVANNKKNKARKKEKKDLKELKAMKQSIDAEFEAKEAASRNQIPKDEDIIGGEAGKTFTTTSHMKVSTAYAKIRDTVDKR